MSNQLDFCCLIVESETFTEHPRLQATTTTNMSGQDFATPLERAILRSNMEREVKQIEGNAVVIKAADQNLVR